jgi:hypothetical protein
MTSNNPRVLDLTAFDRPGERRPLPDHSELYLLRLALDLQLDALLLTLGAAARAEVRGGARATAVGGHATVQATAGTTVPSDDAVPWRRWLGEDVELARMLAGVLVEGEGNPFPTLEDGVARSAESATLDDLAARYESMEDLLVGVLERPSAGQHWRGSAAEALQRCRDRIAELRRHRRAAIALAAASRTSYLPGEWLG